MNSLLPLNQKIENPNLSAIEFGLTLKQFKALQTLMPRGFMLELTSHKRESTPLPLKKKINNDRKPVSQASSTTDPSIHHHTRERKAIKTYSPEHKRPQISTVKPKLNNVENSPIRTYWELFSRLKKHKAARPFLKPVDAEGLGLTDYYDIVKEPMDISTVENKLRRREYDSRRDLMRDVQKIWDNSHRYNQEGSTIYKMTTEMEHYARTLFEQVDDLPFEVLLRDMPAQKQQEAQKVKVVSPRSKKNWDVPLTLDAKKNLIEDIKRLPPDCLRDVFEIVSRGMPDSRVGEEIEFDLDELPVRITRELENFVKSKLTKLQNKMKFKFGEPQKIEIDNKRPLTDYALFEGGVHSVSTIATEKQNEDDSVSTDSSFISDS